MRHSDATSIHLGAYVQAGDPGAVGAKKLWVDTSSGPPYQLKARNGTNDGWETVGTVTATAHNLFSATHPDVNSADTPVGGDVLTYDGGTSKWLAAPPLRGTNPMNTANDLIIGGAAGAEARLAKGANGNVLTVDPGTGNLVWAAPVTGFSDPMTTAGDIIIRNAANATVRLAIGTIAQALVARGGTLIPTWEDQYSSINVVIDGAGSAIATGVKMDVEVPFDCVITRATLLADQSGSVVVDIFKCTYANFDAGATHPVAGDKITAAAPPTITTATKSQDSTLTGWTTSLSAGDIIRFNVNSCTTITRVTCALRVKRA